MKQSNSTEFPGFSKFKTQDKSRSWKHTSGGFEDFYLIIGIFANAITLVPLFYTEVPPRMQENPNAFSTKHMFGNLRISELETQIGTWTFEILELCNFETLKL